MSRIWKSSFLMLSIILVASALLGGCTTGSATTTSTPAPAATTAPSAQASSAATAPAAKLDPYNIIWYTVYPSNPDSAAVVQAINKYLADSTDLNATLSLYEIGWGDYGTKMPVIIASGHAFDVCFTSSWTVTYNTYAAQGAFVDLTKTKLLEQYGQGITSVLSDKLVKGSSINGDLYAVPVNKEGAYQWGLMFLKDDIDKYSLDLSAVKTGATVMDRLNACTPLLKTVHEKDPKAIGWNCVGNSTFTGALPIDFISSIAGLYVDGSTDKVFNVYASKEYKQYYDLMRQWYQAGYIATDAATKTEISAAENQTLFMSYISYTPYAEANSNPARVFVPTYDKPIYNGAAGTGAMTAISTTSKDPARAMMFLNLLYSDPKLLNLFDFGAEGKDYTLDATTGNVTQLTKKATGADATDTALYAPQRWTQGNQFLSYLVGSEPADKWDKYKEFDKNAIVTSTLGFSFDASAVTSEVSALTNVISQYAPSLQTGSVDPNEYLPKFLSALKDAGADAFIAEVQKQYDAWKAANK